MFLTAKITFIYLLGLAAFCLSRRAGASIRYQICAFSLISAILATAGFFLQLPLIPDVFRIVVHSQSRPGWGRPNLFNWLRSVWLAGSAVILLRFLLGLVYLHRQTSTLPEMEEASGVRLRLAPVSTPLVWGFCRPTILLPLNSVQWSEDRRRMAILHEQAHIERRDHWSVLLPMAARSLYWFHPLTWWLSAKLHEQQEIACDQRVLSSGVPAAQYAEFLLELSQQNSSRTLFSCAMVGQTQILRGRIMSILNFRSTQRLSSSKRIALILVPAFLMIALAFLPWGHRSSLWGTTNQTIYKVGGDVTAPGVIDKVEPQYTKAATEKKIQGIAVLSVVIDAAGNPSGVQVVKSLDSGLDQKAIEAIHQWRFTPATKNGEPVAVRATVEIHFRLV